MAKEYNPYQNMLEVLEKAAKMLKLEENKTTMLMGAYIVALDRIVKARTIRGIFP